MSNELIAGRYQLAARGTRLGAFIVDTIFQAIFATAGIFVLGFDEQYLQIWQKMMQGGIITLGDTLFIVAVNQASYLVLNTYLLARRGQTIAKYLFGIAIVDHESGRIVPVAKNIAMRILPVTAVGLVPGVGFILQLANWLCIFGDHRRCVHDYLCGTSVIEVPKHKPTPPVAQDDAPDRRDDTPDTDA